MPRLVLTPCWGSGYLARSGTLAACHHGFGETAISGFDMERAAPGNRCVPSRWAWLCLLLALLHGTAAVAATADQASEAGVRAAFLYQFGNYVDWPEGALGAAHEPFVIAVLGADDVQHELERITRGRRLAGHPVQVVSAVSAESPSAPAVVYVGDAAADQLPTIMALARTRPMLVVCASAEALDQGCMIGFALASSRLRFDVSLRALDAAGLRVSSRLLAVARSVVGKPR